jgi:threonine dehydrogenase-like Zn-dependent dehydrogenase
MKGMLGGAFRIFRLCNIYNNMARALPIGHESFGLVEAVGPNVSEFKPGDYALLTVRRPGTSFYGQIGTMTADDTYFERGVNLRHGFPTEYIVDGPKYIIRVPENMKEVGVLMEPMSGA